MSCYVNRDVERHQRHNDEVLSEYVSPTNTVGLCDMHKLKEFRNCLPTYVLLIDRFQTELTHSHTETFGNAIFRNVLS